MGALVGGGNINFIDICAGIGGFRYGLEQAGHTCIGYMEKDKYARQSYQAMYNTEKEWFAEDVTTIKSTDIPYADIWCFGFPCVNISIAGKREGITGSRSGIYFNIIDLIKGKKYEDRPKLIIAENVANLLSINQGWDYSSVLFEMESAGYDIEWSIYNSKEFGVPQSRRRIYIVGYLRGHSFREILPEQRKSDNAPKQIISGSQGVRVYDTSGTSVTLASNAGGWGGKTGLYFIDLSLGETQITEIARCIVSRYHKGMSNRKGENSGVLEIHNCSIQDKLDIISNHVENGLLRIRRLTPKECFRLQGFPDELFEKTILAGLSDSQLYKQAGNAVTTNVIYEIGKKIKKAYG